MADELNPQDGQATPDSQLDAGTQTAPPAQDQASERGATDWELLTRKAREEAAANRVKLRETEQKLEAMQTQLANVQESTAQALQAQLDQMKAELATANAKAAAEEASRLRLEVASKLGLPPELASRLQGVTPEELEADGQKLAALIPAKSANVGQERRGNAGDTPGLSRAEQFLAQISGKDAPNPFDLDLQRSKGGG